MVKVCYICGSETARLVGQTFGRLVCENCFIPTQWLCRNCERQEEQRGERENKIGVRLAKWPRVVRGFMISFFMILVGMILIIISVGSGFLSSGGVLVFIGPIPFIIGLGSSGSSLTLVGVLVLLLLVVLWFWRSRH